MKRILLPTDFSEASSHAIDYALQLFGRESSSGETQFEIVHIHEPHAVVSPNAGVYVTTTASQVEEEIAVRRKTLSTFMRSWKDKYPEFNMRSRSIMGPVVSTIREIAESLKIDVVVVGSTSKMTLDRKLFGSTALGLVQSAPCPVIIVPPQTQIKLPDKVLFATDFENIDDDDHHILREIKELALAYDSDLMVLNVDEEGQSLRDQAEHMEELYDYFKNEKIDYYFLRDSDTANSIDEFAIGYGADILVLVAQERKFFEQIFHRSIREQMLAQSKIPLLILHPTFWGTKRADDQTFRKRVAGQLDKWQSELEELRLQTHLGSRDAQDAYAQARDKLFEKLQHVKNNMLPAKKLNRKKWRALRKEVDQFLSRARESSTQNVL